MSATKWKTRGSVRPWTPRQWPIPHVGECLAGSEYVVEVPAREAQRRFTPFGGDFHRGIAEQTLTSVHDRVSLMD